MSGGRWDLIRSIVTQVLSLGVAATLARVLTPEEFGFVAVAVVVMGGAEVIGDFGIGSSLVLRGDEDDRRVSSVFWLSVALATGLFAIGTVASPWIAEALGLPEARWLIVCGLGAVALRISSSVPRALLRRRLAFGRITVVMILSFVAYGVAAVALAVVLEAGAWAILIGRVAQAMVLLVAGSVAARWTPSVTFDSTLVGEDLSFGARLSITKVLGYLRKNLDYWFVSRWMGASALGAYYIAYVVPDLARQRFTLTASTVLFPVIARMGGDRRRVARAFLDILRTIGLVTLPTLALVSVMAREIVEVMFGAGWEPAVEPLRWLAVGAAASALTNPPAVMLNASGVPGRNVVATFLGLGALGAGMAAVGTEHGILGVALVVMTASLIQLVVHLAIAADYLEIGIGATVRALAPAVVPLAAGVPAAAWTRALLASEAGLVRLLAGGLAGGLAYGLVAWLLFREPVREALGFGLELLGRPRAPTRRS